MTGVPIQDSMLEAAAARFGTPLFVYDLDAMAHRARDLRERLAPRVEVAYAVKANPSLAVLRRLAGTGVGADVASGGELEAVQRAGFAPETIVITGPGKRDAELAAAAALPLRAITVESIGELDRLRVAARQAGRRVRVLLRSAGTARDDDVIGDGGGRFGMRAPDLLDAARVALGAPEIELIGLHRFDAANVRDAAAVVEAARETVAQASWLARKIGHRFRLIDLGGGLGIPYADHEAPLEVADLAARLTVLVEEVDGDPGLAGATLLLEPGRFIVGPAGVYLSRIIDVKVSDAGRVAIVDGGIHHLLRPALIGREQRLRLVSVEPRSRAPASVTVGGPLCTGLDVLARRIQLPMPRVGDLVAVLDAGAYGFTESMLLFLSHPTPVEAVATGGELFLARPRVDPGFWLDLQDVPDADAAPVPATAR